MSLINEYEAIIKLYTINKYYEMSNSHYIKDSHWKVSKIIPLLNITLSVLNKEKINLLDAGGGAGLILKLISDYIRKKHSIEVRKYLLDLSPKMLKDQKEYNPDFYKSLNEDIRFTSLNTKEIDLTLMIDVLEHVPNPILAIEELKRISKFVIFKIPLENNISNNVSNFIRGGKKRQILRLKSSHINSFNIKDVKYLIQKQKGEILFSYFTNRFSRARERRETILTLRLYNFLASCFYKISPLLCSFIFTDFIMLLVIFNSKSCTSNSDLSIG